MTERRGPREPLLLAATGFTVGLFLGPPSHPALVGLIALGSLGLLAFLLVKRSFLSPTLLVVASVAQALLGGGAAALKPSPALARMPAGRASAVAAE